MSYERPKTQLAEWEVRRNKARELFQRLSWSGVLEPAEFAPDGTPRAGKVRHADEEPLIDGANWIHHGGVAMSKDGNPAELGIVFLRGYPAELYLRSYVKVTYNDTGLLTIRNSNEEELFSGKTWVDHQPNQEAKDALEQAFANPVKIHQGLYKGGQEFLDKYIKRTEKKAA